MATTESTAKRPFAYILWGQPFQSVQMDVPPKILTQVPWVISGQTKLDEALNRLSAIPLGTLFVINGERKLLGVITTSPEVADGCDKAKGGNGGGGGVGVHPGGARNCQSQCDAGCADRGGCSWISYNPFTGACVYECVSGPPGGGPTDPPVEDLMA